MALPPKLQELFDWLVDGAPGVSTPMQVIERIGNDLLSAGVQVDRMQALVRTLHPQVAGRRFIWQPGAPVQVHNTSWEVLGNPATYANSPLRTVFDGTAPTVRYRLAQTPPSELPKDMVPLKEQGFTDYGGFALRFLSGGQHAYTFSTKAPGGFTDEQFEWMTQLCRPLGRIAEVMALMRTAANLLSAYVGRNAGSRVLEGRVQRGEVEDIDCVVWFSDLRGFTTMSSAMQPKEIIGVLNELFDCQVPAIEAHGGEVLKFMGDGMLAIFPITQERDAKKASADGLAASKAALAALDVLNAKRSEKQLGPLRFGIALHLGDVAYGNIGGASRLDFTCIGTTVNVASRIEGLTGKTGHAVLVSEAVAKTGGFPTESIGSYELKGVDKPQAVFAPK
jgi:adenylate cyclase